MHASILTKFLIILFGGLALGFMFYWIATGVLSESKKVGDSAAAIVRAKGVSAQQGIGSLHLGAPAPNANQAESRQPAAIFCQLKYSKV